jgi:hypothetical protein
VDERRFVKHAPPEARRAPPDAHGAESRLPEPGGR